jgi:serine/threonine protein kinase
MGKIFVRKFHLLYKTPSTLFSLTSFLLSFILFVFTKIDVFSYGLLVCEMSICQLPDQIERRNQMRRIPHIGVKNLVRRCTESDPKSRPTMQGVIASWQNME